MGKIHEALAKHEKKQSLKVISQAGPDTRRTQAKPTFVDAMAATSDVDAQRRGFNQIDQNLVVYHDPASMEAEIFKILRNNILFPKEGDPPPSIMITSAVPGDGKSFVAANLAISIAQGVAEHVLLMDCDMRRSRIHRQFGFDDNVPGLCEYLSKGVDLPLLLKKTVVDKLTILPGGSTPANPSELLSSQAMKLLLEETKKRYADRYIIVDSPPPQLTAETTALAKYIDGIVIVVRSGKMPKSLVNDLINDLGREKILGVVLNGYKTPATERYGYGRYKEYKKGYKR
jgi:capsular exopolysaccharide synthesis family protein